MNNIHGILIVIGAMAAFAIEDAFLKSLSAQISIGQILMLLGIFCSALFAAATVATRHSLFHRSAWRAIPITRALCESGAAFCFVTALSRVDLSIVAAIFQATPLAITMGAALFLGERVGWRRWTSICVGFAGVLLIIRPGFEGFTLDMLYVVATVFIIAIRDLVTRLLPKDVPSTLVAGQAYLSLVPTGALIILLTPQTYTPVDGILNLWMLGAIVFGIIGYYGIVTAMRMGDASAITPFRYTRLLFSILLGMMIFSERPDLLTLCGAALIIGSGLYMFMRERRLAMSASTP